MRAIVELCCVVEALRLICLLITSRRCGGGSIAIYSIPSFAQDEPERSRINKAGGRITLDGRVNGGLNLSRAIGTRQCIYVVFSACLQVITTTRRIRSCRSMSK